VKARQPFGMPFARNLDNCLGFFQLKPKKNEDIYQIIFIDPACGVCIFFL